MSDTTDSEREGRTATNDLIGRLWDLGNLITAFCILQVLAFLTVTYTSTAAVKGNIMNKPGFIFLGVGAFTCFFVASVWFCHRKEAALRIDAGHSEIVLATSRHAAWGRVIWIVAFGLLLIARVAHYLLHSFP